MEQFSTRVSVARSIVLLACATSITTVAVAAPVRWSVNGHYYQAVSVRIPDFLGRREAGGESACPRRHLATITSAEETQFVRGLFGNPGPFGNPVTIRSSGRLPFLLLISSSGHGWMVIASRSRRSMGYRRTRLVY